MDTIAAIPDSGIDPQPHQTSDAPPAVELVLKRTMLRLYTRRDVEAGEIIARASKCMLITSDVAAASPPIRRLLQHGETFAQDVCLAVFLADAVCREGPWRTLAAGMLHGAPLHPLFLSVEELDMLRGSCVIEALSACRAQFTAEHERLSRILVADDAITLDDYLRMRSLVMLYSQAIDTTHGRILVMLPLQGMFSHAANASARWEETPQEFVLRMRHATGQNAPLRLSHSGWARDERLAPLGALFDEEENCRTDLVLPEPADVWPAREVIGLFGQLRDGKPLFKISSDLNDNVAHRLLAYLRLTSCMEAGSADSCAKAGDAVKQYISAGKLPPICRDSELLAMQTLRAACQRQLDAFPTCIQHDEQLLGQNATSPLQRSIVSLRLREKHILASFIDVADVALPLLQNYNEPSQGSFPEYLRFAAAGSFEGEKTIFVSIASYRDPLLWDTVRECLCKAERPDLLRFGIVDQNDKDAGDDLARLPFAQQVRYVNVKPRDSRGACWARSIAFGLYGNEDYLLQIDSHMIFDRGWDRNLKFQLQELSVNNPKSILSAYPWGFEIENGQAVRKVSSTGTLALRVAPDSAFAEDSPVLTFQPSPQSTSAHYYAYELAGGFLFTLGSFIDEVPYDSRLYFHGEEQNLTIRAYTRGWDMYHPRVVPLYHLYKRSEHSEKNSPRHWDEEDNRSRQTSWWELEEASKRRMCQLLYTESIKGVYGLGNVRTLEDFAAYSGIDYRNRTLVRRESVAVPAHSDKQ